MKPLQKGVTASDVENCLYYVHLNGPEDEKLLESSLLQDHSPAEISEDAVNGYIASRGTETVRRKPLIPARTSASDYKMEPPSNVNHHYQPPVPDHHKSPLHDPQPQPPSHDPNNQPSLQHLNSEPSYEDHRVGRKPAPPAVRSGAVGGTSSQSVYPLNGPRPMHSRILTTDGRLQLTNTSHNVANLSRRYEQPSLGPSGLPLRAGQSGANYSADNVPAEAEVESSAKVMRFRRGRKFSAQKDCKRDDYRDISLTLIRRYDGLQSNVGKILCSGARCNVPPDTFTAVKSPSKSSVEISIQIFTPGYCRHAGPESEASSETRSFQGSTVPRQLPNTSGGSPSTFGVEPDSVFRRQLRKVSARNQLFVPQERPQAYSRPQSSSDVRLSSEQANGSMQVGGLSPSSRSNTTQSSSKGYTFESPWLGICEFHTGIAGRSLKCTHTSRATDNVSMSAASVSELRFNLPSSNALGPPRTQISSDSSRSSKRSSFFSHHRAKSAFEVPSSSSYGSKIELEERMDLSLANERAGGGFGGKHTKLGKLIVEHEGLKMLDLVVAANIALVCSLSDLRLPFSSL